MHELQKLLLWRLFKQGDLNYASLTKDYDFEDNVVFHLKQLEKNKLIKKRESHYSITTRGIKEIAKYEPNNLKHKGLKTFFVGLFCEGTTGELLLKEHPHARNNFYNLPNGKPHFGEDINQSLVRIFKSNCGIELSKERFSFLSLHLKTIQTSNNETLFDDAFTIYQIKLTQKEINSLKLTPEISWYSKEEVKEIENKWPEVNFCLNTNKQVPYLAYKYTSDYIL